MNVRVPAAADVLDAWERALAQPAWARPLCLLAAGSGGAAVDELADLPVGARDDLLLALRTVLFGDHADAVASCPSCGELAEIELTMSSLRSQAPPDARGGALEVHGYDITFRLPTSVDLDAAAGAGDAVAALLARCVDARLGGTAVDASALPGDVVAAVDEAMAALDQSDIELALTCPGCGTGWQTPLDIAAYLWAEVDAWCARTLGDVDVLARAYGWSEDEVLALSAWRRHHYVELALR